MFTEPADQSVWWYYHFLLTWAEGAGDGREDIYANVLRDERYTLRDLVEVEGRCKVCYILYFLCVTSKVDCVWHITSQDLRLFRGCGWNRWKAAVW